MLKETIRQWIDHSYFSKLLKQKKEAVWAHVYHDSIRDKPWLTNANFNVGRWACNYSFLYVLNRILSDYKPTSILELGLGESSRMISLHLEHSLANATHTILESDPDWQIHFTRLVDLCDRSTIHMSEPETKTINGQKTIGFKDTAIFASQKFDLYIVDAPGGSHRFSRPDILTLLADATPKDQFIIIIDDFDRSGERETYRELRKQLSSKGIATYPEVYEGVKTVLALGTEQYKFVQSL